MIWTPIGNHSELVFAFFSADLPPAVGEQVAATARALSLGDDSLAAAGLRGLTISHPDWIDASRIRSDLRARWQALFREVDVVLCPPMPTVAFPHDHSPLFARVLDNQSQSDAVWFPCGMRTRVISASPRAEYSPAPPGRPLDR